MKNKICKEMLQLIGRHGPWAMGHERQVKSLMSTQLHIHFLRKMHQCRNGEKCETLLIHCMDYYY